VSRAEALALDVLTMLVMSIVGFGFTLILLAALGWL
jgi:hypothetical protein